MYTTLDEVDLLNFDRLYESFEHRVDQEFHAPSTPVHVRARLEAQLRGVSETNPDLAERFFCVLLRTMGHALPKDDPWRAGELSKHIETETAFGGLVHPGDIGLLPLWAPSPENCCRQLPASAANLLDAACGSVLTGNDLLKAFEYEFEYGTPFDLLVEMVTWVHLRHELLTRQDGHEVNLGLLATLAVKQAFANVSVDEAIARVVVEWSFGGNDSGSGNRYVEATRKVWPD